MIKTGFTFKSVFAYAFLLNKKEIPFPGLLPAKSKVQLFSNDKEVRANGARVGEVLFNAAAINPSAIKEF